MAFRQILGNEDVLRALRASHSHGRLAHALIFAGSEGIGKKRAALELAKLILCLRPLEGEPCDSCTACARIESGLHPDCRVIVPDGTQIKIGQIQELSREVFFRPLEGKESIFILDQAERLNEEASNCMLKTLEEPPSTSRLILITSSLLALLSTLRSRCQIFQFSHLSTAIIANYLSAQSHLPHAEAETRARLSHGNLARALQTDWDQESELFQEALEVLQAIFLKEDLPHLLYVAEHFGRDRESAGRWLVVLQTVLRDLLVLSYDRPERVLHRRGLEALRPLAVRGDAGLWQRALQEAHHAQRAIERHANRSLVLERLFLEWLQPSGACGPAPGRDSVR
ncbi:MAG: DNA polymerase III subunit delta' [Acidobacteria bacterium]|nr:DNA polymerase III subunit delta' [Acidobacteriota bacterium]